MANLFTPQAKNLWFFSNSILNISAIRQNCMQLWTTVPLLKIKTNAKKAKVYPCTCSSLRPSRCVTGKNKTSLLQSFLGNPSIIYAWFRYLWPHLRYQNILHISCLNGTNPNGFQFFWYQFRAALNSRLEKGQTAKKLCSSPHFWAIRLKSFS